MSDDKLLQELPFSPALIELYQQWKSSSQEDRMALSLELATVFCAEHDATDTAFSEDYHEAFEVFYEAQLRFEAEALRLSRLAERRITEYLEHYKIDLDDVVIEGPPASN